MRHSQETKDRAVVLRELGMSYSEIASELSLKLTTVVDWVKHVVLSDEQRSMLDRKRRRPDLSSRAIELRRQGRSIKSIAREIGAAQSSVSGWVRHIELTDEQREAIGTAMRRPDGTIDEAACRRLADLNIERKHQRWDAARSEANLEWGDRSADPKFMFGLGLYIGEGCKVDPHTLGVSNCDPAVIRMGIEFYKVIGVDLGALCPNVQLPVALEHRVDDAVAFWSRELSLPAEQFKKTVIDRRKGNGKSSRNPWPNGCCHVKVHDTYLKQKVLRWMELAVGKS